MIINMVNLNKAAEDSIMSNQIERTDKKAKSQLERCGGKMLEVIIIKMATLNETAEETVMSN